MLRRIGRADIRDAILVDLTDPFVVARLGLEPEMLIADDYDVCQDIADEARVAGFDGIVDASAALTRETTVAIFGTAIPHRLTAGPSRVRRPPPRMWLLFRLIRLPAAIAAELGAFYAHLRRGH